MKRSQLFGAIFAMVIIVACFLPWSFVPTRNWTISGMNTMGTHFGKPGIVHCFFSILCLVLFCIPKIWAKRTNIFLAAINLAWGIRNILLVSTCSGGECQTKLYGVYVLIIACVLVMLMSLLPKLAVNEE